MQNRVRGLVGKRHIHLYSGLEILKREEFYLWACQSYILYNMFNKWEESNYDRKLCPTVDRINPTKGYTVDNIRWLTHSENSSNTRKRKNI